MGTTNPWSFTLYRPSLTVHHNVILTKECLLLGQTTWSFFFFFSFLFFGVHSTLMIPQWHVKDTGHSAKSAGGRLHSNMHMPLTQRSGSRLTMLLSMYSVGIIQKQAHTQLVREHSATVPGCRWGMNDWTFSQRVSQVRKKPPSLAEYGASFINDR